MASKLEYGDYCSYVIALSVLLLSVLLLLRLLMIGTIPGASGFGFGIWGVTTGKGFRPRALE